jgi:hypothetical protein
MHLVNSQQRVDGRGLVNDILLADEKECRYNLYNFVE